jgi:hypothetical protein
MSFDTDESSSGSHSNPGGTFFGVDRGYGNDTTTVFSPNGGVLTEEMIEEASKKAIEGYGYYGPYLNDLRTVLNYYNTQSSSNTELPKVPPASKRRKNKRKAQKAARRRNR